MRKDLDRLHVTPLDQIKSRKNGNKIRVAGMITVRQCPGTAKGVVFVTIKDETGFANLSFGASSLINTGRKLSSCNYS